MIKNNIFACITLSFFVVIGILILDYFFIGYSLSGRIDGIITGDSCKATGGKWSSSGCGSACGGYNNKTKEDRIKDERRSSCRFDCTSAPDCTCREGEYYGSREEGCISISKRGNSI